MKSKIRADDVEHLINDKVYRMTTSDIIPTDEETQTDLMNKRSFETRGLVTVIISTILITFILIISSLFIYIQAFYTPSVFTEDSTTTLTFDRKNSTWKTTYVLPDIKLVEIKSSMFDFSSSCPSENFALIINLETPIAKVEPWLKKCGKNVFYFRMNGNELDVEDVNRVVNYVQNAQYIPVKASFHGVNNSYNLLDDSEFREMVDIESGIITSLQLSGYVTPSNLSSLLDLIPFVEELTLEGPELCASLVRQPWVDLLNCAVNWIELRKLKISFGCDCTDTFEFIDRCWQMNQIKHLEIEGTRLNDNNSLYIEHIIDRFRITDSKFITNDCSDAVMEKSSYMCW